MIGVESSIKSNKYNLFLVLILSAGLLLRLFHFFSNRSLWLDEGYLSSSLLRMNYHELAAGYLDYQQKAPIGFLWIVKFFVNVLGKNEYALRMVSLLTGIFSLLFFIPVARFFLKGYGFILALTLLAFAPAIIYHTVEIKQYSTELFCTIMAFYLLIKYKDCKTYTQAFYWGGYGAILLWFSYPVVFLLAGFGMALSLYYILKRKWNLLFLNAIPFLIWFFSFLTNYLLFIQKTKGAKWVVYWFSFYDNFMPLPPKSLADLSWYVVNIYRMLDYPMGLLWDFMNVSSNVLINSLFKMPVLPIFFIFSGIYAFYKLSKQQFLVLLVPVGIVLLASGLRLYPLTERFWIFIVPVFIILLAKGFESIRLKKLKIMVFALILIGPFYQSFSSVLHSEKFYMHKKSFQKEMFNYINSNFEKDDAVYVYWNELPGYKVYKTIENYKYSAVEGHDFRSASKSFADYNKHLKMDFKEFAGNKRVWLVFNNKYLANVGDMINDPSWYYESGFNPTKNLELEFRKIAIPLKKVVTADITVCLYELKNINP